MSGKRRRRKKLNIHQLGFHNTTRNGILHTFGARGKKTVQIELDPIKEIKWPLSDEKVIKTTDCFFEMTTHALQVFTQKPIEQLKKSLNQTFLNKLQAESESNSDHRFESFDNSIDNLEFEIHENKVELIEPPTYPTETNNSRFTIQKIPYNEEYDFICYHTQKSDEEALVPLLNMLQDVPEKSDGASMILMTYVIQSRSTYETLASPILSVLESCNVSVETEFHLMVSMCNLTATPDTSESVKSRMSDIIKSMPADLSQRSTSVSNMIRHNLNSTTIFHLFQFDEKPILCNPHLVDVEHPGGLRELLHILMMRSEI